MRSVVSLSLPPAVEKQMKQRAKARGHASVSSYVQYLLTLDADTISEAELLKSVQEAQRDYQQGKTVQAHSLAELL